MLKSFVFLAVMALVPLGLVHAQTPTPEELVALIDERMNAQNPYRALLADPDPERSLVAMQVMLETGDPELTRMALEFGLLSPNRSVQRVAVEAFMAQGPILSLRFDGTGVQDNDYPRRIRNTLGGSLDANNIGFGRLSSGTPSGDVACLVDSNGYCRTTINADGVFVTLYDRFGNLQLSARLELNDAGQLEGSGSLADVSEPIPITIQLMD